MTTAAEAPTLTPVEINDRLDGPIHSWFGLSYSNYLVLCRSMMQSMPVEWQIRAVALFDELDQAFPDLPRAPRYIVEPGAEKEYAELTEREMKLIGVTAPDREFGDTDDVPDVAEAVFRDRNGDEHQGWERTLVPTGADPVPHYNRGRTFLAPTGGAA